MIRARHSFLSIARLPKRVRTPFNQFFNKRIINRSDQKTDRIFKCRPTKTKQLPGPQVPGQKDYAAPPLLGLAHMSQAHLIVIDHPAQAFWRRLRKFAELPNNLPKLSKQPRSTRTPLLLAEIRKGDQQIPSPRCVAVCRPAR